VSVAGTDISVTIKSGQFLCQLRYYQLPNNSSAVQNVCSDPTISFKHPTSLVILILSLANALVPIKCAVQRGRLRNRLWPWRRPFTKKAHVRSPANAWRTQWQWDRTLCVVPASSTYSLIRPARYTASSRRLLKKLRNAQVVKTSPQFTDSSSSLPCSQQPPRVFILKALQSHSFEIHSFITLPSVSRFLGKCFLLPHHKQLYTFRPSTTLYNLRN
jgi:hypothetical protein